MLQDNKIFAADTIHYILNTEVIRILGFNRSTPNWASKGWWEIHQTANVWAMFGYWIDLGPQHLKYYPLPPSGPFREAVDNLRALNDGVKYADEDQFQNGASSYRHAMSNEGQSPQEAMEIADKFVRKQFSKAKELLRAGNTYQANFEFGIGLHTLQDATSPSHSGFKKWGDHVPWYNKVFHVLKEDDYPGIYSHLQAVTNTYVNWFIHSNENLPSINLFKNIQSD